MKAPGQTGLKSRMKESYRGKHKDKVTIENGTGSKVYKGGKEDACCSGHQFVDRSGIIKSTFMMKIKDDGGAAGAIITIKAEANVSTDNGETYKIESDEITTTDVYELVENPSASLEGFRSFSAYDKQPIDETTQFVEMCNPTLFKR